MSENLKILLILQEIECFCKEIKNHKIYFKEYILFKLYKKLGICLNANF